MKLNQLFYLSILVFLFCGCDKAMEGAKEGWNEGKLKGTWKITSVEGAKPTNQPQL